MRKFYLETYGCKLNQSDSDLIRGFLSQKFKETSSLEEADFVVINSCGVVGKTERKILKRMKEIKDKKILVAGCLSLISPKKVSEFADGIIGPKDIPSVVRVAEEILQEKKISVISRRSIDKARYFSIKRRKEGDISAIVPISEGCLGDCKFCATKYARGKLFSFSMNNILKEIEFLVESGYKEIQLTSQDSALYGLEKGDFLLPDLINKIDKIDKDFRVRVGMTNPFFAKKIIKELISSFKSKKVYKFIHIPLQSGDNNVLKEMNRNYRVEDFIDVVSEFRNNFDDVLLATDIIVGYPGETKESFEKTLSVIKETRPSIIHIFRFSKRPHSKTQDLKDFPDRIKKERSRKLTKLSRKINLEDNKQFLGKEFDVLISGEGKKGTVIGRTSSFRAVVLREGKLGDFKRVKIVGFKENYLKGKVIS